MRTDQAMKNTTAIITQRVVQYILYFVVRTIFIHMLGVTYLGINSLFTDIFQMLSLMELGVGLAFTYFMYEPIANEDYDTLNSLMYLYAKLYRTIGIGVAFVGLILLPFLPKLIEQTNDIPDMHLIYLLLLSNTVTSYFLSYKQTIYTAFQREYVNVFILLTFNIIRSIFQGILLVYTRSFPIYLLIELVSNLLSNLYLSRRVDKEFSFLNLKNVTPLPAEKKTFIYSRIRALFLHRLAGVVMFGTDNIIFSFFTSLQFIGRYSNYTLIIRTVEGLLLPVFEVLTPSIGNLAETESNETAYTTFKRVYFLNSWFIGFGSIALFFLLNPFIELWLDSSYLLDSWIVLLITITFYLAGIRTTSNIFVNAKGLFWKTRYKPLIETVIDVVASVSLGIVLKEYGVILGNIIGLATTSYWYDAFVLYRHWFKKSYLLYIKMSFKSILTMLGVGGVMSFVIQSFDLHNRHFFILMSVVLIGTNLIYILLFHRSKEYIYYRGLFWSIAKKICEKLKRT